MISQFHLADFLKEYYCTFSYLINLKILSNNDIFLFLVVQVWMPKELDQRYSDLWSQEKAIQIY